MYNDVTESMKLNIRWKTPQASYIASITTSSCATTVKIYCISNIQGYNTVNNHYQTAHYIPKTHSSYSQEFGFFGKHFSHCFNPHPHSENYYTTLYLRILVLLYSCVQFVRKNKENLDYETAVKDLWYQSKKKKEAKLTILKRSKKKVRGNLQM